MSNNSISFFNEDTNFELTNTPLIKNWLQSIAKEQNKIISNINYIFCSDEYLLNINKKHLNHDYYTDIITFDLSEGDDIESDIFISIERVKENALKLNASFQKELNRVIVHGLLHLVGFNDKTEQEKVIMRKKEDSCLSLLKI